MTRDDPVTTARERFRQDVERYQADDWLQRRGWWWHERTVWAVAFLRFGQWALESNTASRRLGRVVTFAVQPLVLALTGIEIWPGTDIGGGLRIYHGGNIVINAGSRIGARCVLRQGVTIGRSRRGELACPTIGDDVEFGAYAQVLGGITVGDGARIGAMSVVLRDVPSGATVVGAPARPVGG